MRAWVEALIAGATVSLALLALEGCGAPQAPDAPVQPAPILSASAYGTCEGGFSLDSPYGWIKVVAEVDAGAGVSLIPLEHLEPGTVGARVCVYSPWWSRCWAAD